MGIVSYDDKLHIISWLVSQNSGMSKSRTFCPFGPLTTRRAYSGWFAAKKTWGQFSITKGSLSLRGIHPMYSGVMGTMCLQRKRYSRRSKRSVMFKNRPSTSTFWPDVPRMLGVVNNKHMYNKINKCIRFSVNDTFKWISHSVVRVVLECVWKKTTELRGKF
jgi:hypothetical protein